MGRLETPEEVQQRLAVYDFPADLEASIPRQPMITASPTNGRPWPSLRLPTCSSPSGRLAYTNSPNNFIAGCTTSSPTLGDVMTSRVKAGLFLLRALEFLLNHALAPLDANPLVAGRALLEAIAAATTEPSATFAYVEVGAVLGGKGSCLAFVADYLEPPLS